ncbi:hypothetical protein BJF79_46270 [Actinomadura sp. CNU-125]|nr:hypothetical protein BJF79_46270 [Actinomadura sp. CNU-125]
MAGARPPVRPARSGAGSARAVDLAVAGHRDLVEADERDRNHVLGQPRGDELTKVGLIGGGPDDVGDEPLGARLVLAGDHYGLVNVVVGRQDGLDLGGLDPEPADLDLLVGASREVEDTVVRPTGQVAGAVHAARVERARDEPFGGESRTARIAARQAVTCQVQLPDDAGRNRA